MNFEVKLSKSDVDRITKKLSSKASQKQTIFELRSAIDKGLKAVRIDSARAHRYTMRTGNLNRSIHHYSGISNQGTLFGKIGLSGFSKDRKIDSKFGVKYGIFVHEGQRSWAPDRFITDNFESNKSTIKGFISEALKKIVGRFK